MRYRRTALAAAAATSLAMLVMPAVSSGATAVAALPLGVPTVVDPVRGGGEPIIAMDSTTNPWISAPAGTGTQTSWYWHSTDGGQTYTELGPSGGHWVCPHTGGGDSLLIEDPVSKKMYVTDQEALASLATGVYDEQTGTLTSKCLATPAMTADRPFEAVLHPTTTTTAPQWTADGHKPMVYMSWLCDGCGAVSPNGPGGLAFAWTTDGVTWHAADPNVPADTLVTDQFYEAPTINSFMFHGTMVADPKTGYVYTGISCGGSCANGKSDNEVGIAIGHPGPHTDATNAGQFASETYQTAANTINGKPMPTTENLFPIITRDSSGTLYEAWIQGDGNDTATAAPLPTEWHLYYTYAKDAPLYQHWAAPQRVDLAPGDQTSVMGWMTAGDKGKLGFVWLGSSKREQPSLKDNSRTWHAFMGVVTNADSSHPSYSESAVGVSPMNYSDICLLGTLCAATSPPGNRNMADFVSLAINKQGGLTATFADDANRIAPKPSDLIAGVPVTMSVSQVGGPKLVGSGSVSTSLFSTARTSHSPLDPAGDASVAGSAAPSLDLRRVHVVRAGDHYDITVDVNSLASTASPSTTQPNVWYVVTWMDAAGHLWFARAESDSGGALSFHAGEPASYDRPGLAYYTIPTLVDYSGGTAITGSKSGNSIVMHVPAALVGSPSASALMESVTGWSILANTLPPAVAPGPGNVPTVVDATAAFDAPGHASTPGSTTPGSTTPGSTPGSTGSTPGLANTGASLGLIGGLALLLVGAAVVLHRRRMGRPDRGIE